MYQRIREVMQGSNSSLLLRMAFVRSSNGTILYDSNIKHRFKTFGI
jgi:hypothetical protein